MKHIMLNLKRFDIPYELKGINRLKPMNQWASHIVSTTQEILSKYAEDQVEFIQYYPEAHIMDAVRALKPSSPITIGCQGVYRMDVGPNNFGAFTTNRTATAMKALGVRSAIIGHCEERADINGILLEAGTHDTGAVNRILNQEIRQAVKQGLKVLYCIGEHSDELDHWQDILSEQLYVGLDGIDLNNIVIGYEPVWAIGPGKEPPGRNYIADVARYIKRLFGEIDIVYGGGLNSGNAKMLASIEEIDGSLIALTNFTGDIGFYPKEYLQIIDTYLGPALQRTH